MVDATRALLDELMGKVCSCVGSCVITWQLLLRSRLQHTGRLHQEVLLCAGAQRAA